MNWTKQAPAVGQTGWYLVRRAVNGTTGVAQAANLKAGGTIEVSGVEEKYKPDEWLSYEWIGPLPIEE